MTRTPNIAEIIAIGDELISGVRLDTNTQWISQALQRRGAHVAWHTSVGDQMDDLVAAFQIAAKRADIVITSGGLGPTADDLTRDALAQMAGVPLVLHEPSLAHIEKIFAARNRAMPERNRQQAMLPKGADVIPNPHGTAPGIGLQVEKARGGQFAPVTLDTCSAVRFFSLPGVPAELKEMWLSVSDALDAAFPQSRVTVHHEIHCFGAGESDVEAMLPDLIRRGRDPSVGITASQATITLRVTTSGANEDECLQRMAPTVAVIRESLGQIIFGENGTELQDAVIAALAEREESLAVLEFGPSGQLAFWLAEADARARGNNPTGKHRFHSSSVCTRQNDEALTEAACATLKQWDVDWVLAVGPYPELQSESASNAIFHVVLTSREPLVGENTGQHDGVHFRLRAYPFASHPKIARVRAAKIALNALRKELLRAE